MAERLLGTERPRMAILQNLSPKKPGQELQRVLIPSLNSFQLCALASVAPAAVKSHRSQSVRCWKPRCLLQPGIFTESSRECHTLSDAIQYTWSLPRERCRGYVTRARALKCRNVRWVSQPASLASAASVALQECETTKQTSSVRSEAGAAASGLLHLPPEQNESRSKHI